jgi:hypothetical protein
MSDLPAEVRRRLTDPAYRRRDVAPVHEALAALGASVPETFRRFYEQFAGPFGSERTGFALLDLCDQDPNIVSVTGICRKKYGWPATFLVLTELLGNSVLVLEATEDRVFDVDFEGGDRLLLNRQLPPAWSSFNEFLGFYFG